MKLPGLRYYWQENRRLNGERRTRAQWWSSRRLQLELGTRDVVARRLGLSYRTLERYECDGAPTWYDFALVGLWAEAQLPEKAKPTRRSK